MASWHSSERVEMSRWFFPALGAVSAGWIVAGYVLWRWL